MPSTRWNGIITPVNSDAYQPTVDFATLGDKSNVPVKVSSQAARDALTPPGGKYAGMAVIRLDVPGEPIEVYNGTSWDRHVSPVVQANTQHAGSGMALNAFTTGVLRPWIQAGSVDIPQEANGYGTITYPTPFPNGLISCGAINANNAVTGRGWSVSLGTNPPTVYAMYVNLSNGSGTGFSASGWRCNWWAIGW